MGEDPAKINQFLDIVFSYGPIWVYLVLSAVCFIENVFPPFPGDSFIVAAGALVALARLDPVLTLLTIILSGMSSVMLIYGVGSRFGRAFFIRKNYRYFSAADVIRAERYFRKWGAMIVIFSRFVVGFRSTLTLVIGISRYHPVKMLIYSVVSYLLFAGLLMYAGMALVQNLDVFRDYFRTYNLIVWPILIILIIYYIIRRFRSLKQDGK